MSSPPAAEAEVRPVDEDEIHRFVDTEYPRVVAAVAMATGDRNGAEDAVQEAMVKAWQRRDEIDRLGAWITVVATNQARSTLRSRGAEDRATDRLEGGMRTAAPTREPDSDLGDDPLGLRDVIAELPMRQRQVVVLHYYLDHSVRACATAMEVSEGTVKTSLHRARAALELALTNEPGAPS